MTATRYVPKAEPPTPTPMHGLIPHTTRTCAPPNTPPAAPPATPPATTTATKTAATTFTCTAATAATTHCSHAAPSLILLLLCASCTTTPSTPLSLTPTPPPAASPTLPTLTPFSGWRVGPRMSFERDLKNWNPALTPHALSPADLTTLDHTLAGLDEAAMRAALLLGHSRDPQAADLLLQRLNQRIEGPNRNSDAADVAAAALLATWPADPHFTLTLTELATGPTPHPDLEVRVECAASALARKQITVTSFLLRILRASTPAQLSDPPDWTPKPTMAWSKSRAATALSRHLSIPVAFRPDASYEDQLAEVDRLVALLKERRPR